MVNVKKGIKYLIMFLINLTLIACAKPEPKSPPPKPEAYPKDKDMVEKPVLIKPQERAVLLRDSIQIFGHTLRVYQIKEGCCLIDAQGDTLIKDGHDQMSLERTDFNYDGVDDILVGYFPPPPVQDLLMFDPQTREFVKVENFINFPEPEPIKGTKYFYSYHRSGCADANWDSDLFYIENHQAIQIGNISGNGCRNGTNTIEISKIKDAKSTLVVTFPLEIIDNYKNFKWGFIKGYWRKNYALFAEEQIASDEN